VGIGSRFNVLNFGQMLLFHALLVRRRGVVPPIAGTDEETASRPWNGPTRRFDLVKEFVIALVAVTVLAVGLAGIFSSPDERAVTLQRWSRAAPNDFVLTATTELDGTSGSASYGAPYNRNAPGQKLGPLALQRWAGQTIPVDSANVLVITPLRQVPGDEELTAALKRWDGASRAQQTQWASSYDDALQKAPDNNPAKVKTGSYGPVPTLTASLLSMAQSGGLDGVLLTQGAFYATDYTRPLLFIADGTYLESLARDQHLGGDQWGMMNETGRYPGQAWLWLYTFWYQVKPFSTSGNADSLVWALMMLLTLVFVLVPFIPGVRSIPKWIPVHRLIWRSWYREHGIAQ
jgi:hypothetical protein